MLLTGATRFATMMDRMQKHLDVAHNHLGIEISARYVSVEHANYEVHFTQAFSPSSRKVTAMSTGKRLSIEH